MAIVIGTNSGFVTVAPTVDPGGTAVQIDIISYVSKDTSPSTAAKITEIGWWCDTATEESNFEVGLYAADGAVVPNEAGTRLYHDNLNAKGTSLGWKTVSVDWDIDGDTDYWIGVQVDNTTTVTRTNQVTTGGPGFDFRVAVGALFDPYGGGAINEPNGMMAFYAVWEAATGTNHQIISGNGLSWFTTEYFGVWITLFSFVVLSIINTLKQFSIG